MMRWSILPAVRVEVVAAAAVRDEGDVRSACTMCVFGMASVWSRAESEETLRAVAITVSPREERVLMNWYCGGG